MSVWTQDPSTRPAPMAEAELPQSLGYRLKTAVLGAPLTRQALGHQRLSKILALGVLSSDCISSSAYGTEEMLIVLLPAFGLAGFTILLPLTAVILLVLTIVSLSYLDVVSVYTQTGGSYVVARENFGPVVAQVAAVALMLDYIVTVAVQSAAGTDALTSAFPSLSPYILEITVGVVLILCYGNLRGIREAGKAFALPTYLFAGSVLLVLGIGIAREVFGDLPTYRVGGPQTFGLGSGTQVLTWTGVFLLLRAFANGGSSLTGLEAISNGVSVFRKPEGRNARKTLVAMSLILGTLVAGVSWLAHQTHAQPYVSGTPTVISQVAQAVLGQGLVGHTFYLFVQASTTLILWTGANTPFSGFPFLASFVAGDQFLPRQLTRRGHRLAFSNGIIVLTVVSTALLIFTKAQVDQLVAFYAIGVFTGFTLAGFGMAKYFATQRRPTWRRRVVVNVASGTVSFAVVITFAVVKFTEGAWLIVLIFPIAVAALIRLNRQYRREAAALALVFPQVGPGSDRIPTGGEAAADPDGRGPGARSVPRPTITRHDVVVLTDGVDLATVAAVRYARTLKPSGLRAVHFVIDDVYAEQVRQAWVDNAALRDIPLELVDCPDRRLTRAVLELAARHTMDPHAELTLLLPRRTYAPVLGRLLHDHTADEIARATSRLPRVVATVVPFDVAGLLARRDAALAGARRHADAHAAQAQDKAAQAQDKAAQAVVAQAPRVDAPAGGDPGGDPDGDPDGDPGGDPDGDPGGEMPADGPAVPARPVRPAYPTGPGPARPEPATRTVRPMVPPMVTVVTTGSKAAAAPSAGLLVAAGSRRAPARTPISQLQWRQRATVQGYVRSVRLAPMSGAPSVEVDLWDETGGVTLIFFGRRAVPGISAGTHLAAEGMVGNRGGRLAICNPLYRLLGTQQN